MEENNNKIKVFCYTNLDDYKGKKWPEYFTCKPEKGEKVECSTGEVLKVVSITHKMDFKNNEPYLDIELWR